jgi:hypothetical protein
MYGSADLLVAPGWERCVLPQFIEFKEWKREGLWRRYKSYAANKITFTAYRSALVVGVIVTLAGGDVVSFPVKAMPVYMRAGDTLSFFDVLDIVGR